MKANTLDFNSDIFGLFRDFIAAKDLTKVIV